LETTEALAPDPDIQAIMTVLRRRILSFEFWEHGEPERIDLHETNLSGADLARVNLVGADLSKANLSKAHALFAANLSHVNLFRANLSEAILSGSILLGAYLAVELTQGQLAGALGDEDIKLPPHLKPPAHWGVKPDEQSEGN
jgi:pentapeptide repeat protein